MNGDVIQELAWVLAGDAGRTSSLAACSGADLARAADALGPLQVRIDAVVRVLDGLQSGVLSEAVAQEWAAFVRRGYIGRGSAEPVRPLGIGTDPENEEAIFDVVSRLDELGDGIDGRIEPHELVALRRTLMDV